MAAAKTLNNRLLRALSPSEFESIFADLQLVELSLRQVIYEASSEIQQVFFPENCLASVITTMADGDTVEVGMIAAEGIVGIPALLGSGVSEHQIIMQAQGSAYRMDAVLCKAIFNECVGFRDATLRFFEDFINLAGQTAACNRLHSIEQRCARWLLMATDRLHSDEIPMTHEFLSAMLGTRRSGVTEAAGVLQRAGLIKYRHGQLTITDRERLKLSACECYLSDCNRLKNLRKS